MRLRTLRYVVYGFFLILLIALFMLQVVQGPRFAAQSEKNRIRLVAEGAARGLVFDRSGVPLVENVLSFDIVAFPQEIEATQAVSLFRRLSGLIGLPAASLVEKYHAAPPAGFSPVLLAPNVDRRTAFAVEQEMANLRGITVQPRIIRRYPFGPVVGHIVGYVGKMSELELLADLRPYGVTAKDVTGKSGVEKSRDAVLRGNPGGMQLEVNSRGAIVRVLSYRPPVAGSNLTLTVDVRLQEKLHALFADRVGAAVIMDAASGEILALHSVPAYDPNLFVDQNSAALSLLLRDARSPLLNRALNAYAPGSIFKIVTAYAGLFERKINPATTFTCTGEFTIGNAVRHCWQGQGHGSVDLAQALAQSCNVYFWETGLRVGNQALARHAQDFGFGQPTGIELPGEQAGVVPSAAWKTATLKERWYGGDMVNFAIGQGYLLVTPLQAVRMAGLIASGGRPVRPILVKGNRPAKRERAVLRPELVASLQHGMGLVVQAGAGTGRRAAIEGLRIFGKTGTAEVRGGEPHAWFVGYVTLAERTFCFAFFVERGGHGGDAPVEIAQEAILFLKDNPPS